MRAGDMSYSTVAIPLPMAGTVMNLRLSRFRRSRSPPGRILYGNLLGFILRDRDGSEVLCGLFIRPITKASLWLVSRTVQLVRIVIGEAGFGGRGDA